MPSEPLALSPRPASPRILSMGLQNRSPGFMPMPTFGNSYDDVSSTSLLSPRWQAKSAEIDSARRHRFSDGGSSSSSFPTKLDRDRISSLGLGVTDIGLPPSRPVAAKSALLSSRSDIASGAASPGVGESRAVPGKAWASGDMIGLTNLSLRALHGLPSPNRGGTVHTPSASSGPGFSSPATTRRRASTGNMGFFGSEGGASPSEASPAESSRRRPSASPSPVSVGLANSPSTAFTSRHSLTSRQTLYGDAGLLTEGYHRHSRLEAPSGVRSADKGAAASQESGTTEGRTPNLVDLIRQRTQADRGLEAPRTSGIISEAATETKVERKHGTGLGGDPQSRSASSVSPPKAQGPRSPATPQVATPTTISPNKEVRVTPEFLERVAMLEEHFKQNGSPLKPKGSLGGLQERPENAEKDELLPADAPCDKRHSSSTSSSTSTKAEDASAVSSITESNSPKASSKATPATSEGQGGESGGASPRAEPAVSPPATPGGKGPGKGKGKAKGTPPPPKAAGSPNCPTASPPSVKGKGKGPPPKAPPRGAPKAGADKSKPTGPEPHKAEIKPQVNMKKLFWSSFVLADQEFEQRGSTVWTSMDDQVGSFDIEELELLFAESQPGRSLARSETAGGAVGSRRGPQRMKVFEESRRRQVCVMLARLPPVDVTVAAVSEMDDARLDKDQVELLLATAPPAEELATLRSTAAEMEQKEDPLQWEDAETFVLKLGEVPSFLLRLQVWSFENSFEERYGIFHTAATEVKDACHALRNSSRAQRLLGLALSVGNYLNAGTSRGRADGFSVEVLEQLRTLKGQAPRAGSATTLVDFLVRQAEKVQPGELDGLFGEVGEATIIHQASRHKLMDLSQELQSYQMQAQGLAKRAKSAEDDSLSIRAQRMEARLQELDSLQKLFAEAEEGYASLCVWFRDGSGKKQRPPDEFFGHWNSFFQAVRASLEGLYGGRTRRRKAPRSIPLRPLETYKRSLTLSQTVKDEEAGQEAEESVQEENRSH
mmetsp:Transcript_94277/g.167647  ORF Transcript_94277/g.167647 Transcript_94277/m.167647 type:complete len:1002 (-) Transcript_94277:30-3035(-)|eukprot:CAMPEP_0197626512 /NCGR_PEP_ID=MMETSP1338-20131121/5443_1 /TAXON_ID=43686 ORGANISM="Pelagodinium beii, Strain RCC1491" /NCGR_SAMPLE_ID=MMETSP1338 /ASSEMBLY_ACC=CAM_ASM_000754 /LENGTH=1001 /DNA_ID=CAMNT_0043197053 /DNA_START=86 /DNA_END=3091 /DNA_ORIENTATION=+